MVNENELKDVEVEAAVGGANLLNYDTGKYIQYVVKKGDCLSVIGANHGVDWRLLYQLNKNVIGPNYNLINPGMVLRVPVR